MKFFLLIHSIAVILTIIVIILRTNSSSKALAYILLVVLLPVLGIIIYFSIGDNFRKRKLYKKKLKMNKKKYEELKLKIKKYHQDLMEDESNEIGHFYKLANNNRYEYLTSSKNHSELLLNGEHKFPKLLQDLKSAKEHIHLEYYIYEDDTIGNEIAEILIQKVKEGVKVRFIYDDFGSQSIRNSFKERLKEAGVEIVPFYKIRWLLFADRINYRNHRKIVVIDGKIGYVGGINVSDKYINNKKQQLYWRDTHVRIEGASVQALQQTFLTDWNFCAEQDIPLSSKYFPLANAQTFQNGQVVQIVACGPDSDYPNILFAMTQAIMLAQKQVLITTPYFIPDASFIDALKITSMSGVKIKLIVPGISDSKLVNAVSNSYYEELMEAGVEVYKYQKGFVHAKTIICDDMVSFVGTANLDQRSFELNFEIHAIVYGKTFTEQHIAAFHNDLRNSKKINLEEWKNRPKIQYFYERTARLVSPLM